METYHSVLVCSEAGSAEAYSGRLAVGQMTMGLDWEKAHSWVLICRAITLPGTGPYQCLQSRLSLTRAEGFCVCVCLGVCVCVCV